MKLSGLGRGLESIIPKTVSSIPQKINAISADENLKIKESVFLVEIDKIRQNPEQPRRDFDENELKSLSDSIREHGILQPLIISKVEEEVLSGIKITYELIAGERRLKAAKMAGLNFVPAIIKPKAAAKDKLVIALIENIQRADLNAMEKARGYNRLSKDFGLTQVEIGRRVGQSREAIANAVRLLDLPVEIQRAIEERKISEGHGRAILATPDNNKRMAMFSEILMNNLSVRAAESLSRQVKGVGRKIRKGTLDPEAKEWESRLEEFLGTRVRLAKAGGRGNILIEFYSPEELNSILDKILKS